MNANHFQPWLIFALLSAACCHSRAADVVWTNAGSANWSGALNWSPNQVPGPGDNVFITNNGSYSVTISGDASAASIIVGGSSDTQTVVLSAGTLTLAVSSAIGSQGSMTFSGGALAGGGDVTISGVFNWSGGTMTGAGRTILSSGATANFTGAGTKGLNRTLESLGTVNYTGTALTFGFGLAVAGVINNATGGVFNVTAEGDFAQSSAAAHAFNNSGTFSKSGAGTTTDFTAVAFHNSGMASVTVGTLNLNSGGSNSGVLDLVAGTTLNLNGTFTQAAGGTISGAGTINFPGGTHNLAGQLLPTGAVNLSGATVNFNAPQSFPNLTFSSGTLAGSANVTLTALFSWTAGTMAGTGRTILDSGATANFTGAGTKGLNRTFDNSGTITYSGTVLTFGFGVAAAGVINNLVGGVFNVTGDGDFNQSSTAAHAFNNSGTFNRSGAGTSTVFTGVTFNNTGTANVTAGTLSLPSSGSNSGLIDLLAGTTLSFSGNFNNLAGGTIGGAGNVSLPAGTHNFVGPVLTTGTVTISGATVNVSAALALARLTLSSGTLQGGGNVTITNVFNWSAGTMAGAGHTVIANGATANVTSTSTKGLNRTIDNSGTLNYSGNNLYFGYGAAVPGVINNLAGGVINALGEADFLQSSAAAHAVNNAGTFNKTGAGTDTDFTGVVFNNTGTVNLTSGTLSINSGGSNSGTIDAPAGTALNLGGSFTHALSGTIGGAGTFNFLNGTHNFQGQFLPTGTVNFNGGTITIANTMASIVATISGATVNFSVPQALTTLTMSGGAMQGNGDVTVTGTLNWSAGTMGGAGHTILPGGATANVTSASSKGLNRTLDNSGTLNYSGNNLYFGYGAAVPGVINNLVGGVINAMGEADFLQSSAAAHAVNNAGTFNKTGAGTDTDFTGVVFNNTGTVNLTSGTLSINSGGANNMALVVPAGTALNLGGTFTHAAGSTLSGAGTFNFNNGTHNFLGPFLPTGAVNFNGGTITIANTMPSISAALGNATLNFNAPQTLTSLTMSGGTLQGSGNVTISNIFNWSAGTMAGAGRIIFPSGATANFTSTSTKGLNRTVDNSGTLNYSGNNLYFGYGVAVAGVINNLVGGVINATGEADFLQSSAAAHAVNNSGTFNKSGAGTETDFTGVAFNNTATVNFTSGTLSLNSGGANTTTLAVPVGTALNLGGTFTHAAGSTLSGAGTINFNNGTHNFLGQFLPTGAVNFNGGTITIANTMPAISAVLGNATLNFNAAQNLTSLTMSGGTLQGSGSVTISNLFNWSNGTMAGAGRTILPSGATANVTSASSKGLNRTLDNSGMLNYSGNNLYFGYGAAVPGVINNLAGGVINAVGEADFLQSSAAAHAVNNAGTFNKTGAATTTDFTGVAFNNSNIVNVPSGTLELNGVAFPGASVLQSVTGATLRLPTGHLTGTTTNSEQWSALGRVLFDGGGSRQLEIMGRDLGNVPAGYTNNFAYGTLQLAGGVTVTLINAADNVPGAEALYVDTIIVPAGTTFNLAGLPVYARNTQISGVVTNGTISTAVGEQFADLKVEALAAPGGASVGEVLVVNWTVRNTTNASAATPVSVWQDRVVLSTDTSAGNGDDRILATLQHNGALAIDAAYATNATVTLPNNLSGNLYLFVITDSGNAVYEFGYETNNSSAGLPITVAAPDLVVSNLIASATGTAGGTVPVTWTVTNLGPGIATADWSDRIYISTNATFDGSDTLLVAESTAAATPLAVGAAYTRSRTVTIPGQYIGLNYLLVVADGTLNQLETVETNNVAAVPIEINASDLEVNGLEVTPAALMSGTQIVVRWNDTNSGVGPARGPWYDQIVVSNLTTGVKLVDTTVYYDSNVSGAISNGQSRARQYSFRLPDGLGGAGQLVFRVRADVYNAVPEYNLSGTGEGNNLTLLTRNSTLSAYPDLQVTNLAVTPAVLQSGLGVMVTWDNTNSGNASVESPFYDRLIVRNLTTAETFVNTTLYYNPAVATNGPIVSGQSRSRGYFLVLPNGTRGAGQLEFAVTSDINGNVFEYNAAGTSEGNNAALLVRSSVLAPYPDLTVSNIVAPATGLAGQQVDVAWTVANQGDAAASGSWSEQVFLADNAAGGNNIYLASVFNNGGLAAGASTTRTARVTLPAFSTGNKFLVVRVDSGNQIYELNETNNAAVDEQPMLLPASLTLAFTAHTFSEAAGSNASQGTLIRNTASGVALDVTLTSSDPTSAVVPALVTIPAGAASVSFPVAAQDNSLVDSNRTVTVSAVASGFSSVSNTLTVTDNDVRTLTLQVISSTVAENAGPVAALGYLSRNADTNDFLVITLGSDNLNKLTVSPTVTMNPGERNAAFAVNAVDNSFVDGTALVKIQASASNYNTVSTTVTVTDNDTVIVSLSVADSTVTEGSSSPATIGTVTRSLVNSRELSVLLTTVPTGPLSVPSRVTIPANQASATFNINAPNDNLATGTRTVNIIGKALSDQGLVVESSIGSVPLQVLDNDGATLTLTVSSALVAEGGLVTGQVARNTGTNGALLVTLSNSAPGEAQMPPSVTISAGQTFVNFTIAGTLDGITDGSKPVTITASAPGFNDGSAGLNVSDIDMPDLRVSSLILPTNGLTDTRVSITWQVLNDGLAPASGSWVDRIYISKDAQLGGDTLLGTVNFNGSLGVSQTYTRTQSVLLPSQPGNFWILIVTDDGGSVTEGSERNNVLARPVTIVPAYRATVETDVEVAANGTPIPIRGRATNTVDGAAARFKLVTTRVQVMGSRRVITSVTDGSGNFRATFQPLPNEAGQYIIGADHPLVTADANQDQFSILGLRASPDRLNVRLVPNQPLSGQIQLRNLSEVPITGLTATPNVPPGLNVQLNIPSELSGMSTGLLSYTITSTITQQANATFVLHITSAEGATLDVPGSASITPLRPQLVATPAFLARGMLRDTQTVVSFEVSNNGGAPSGDLRVTLPPIPWLALISASNVSSLLPGQKTTVTLALNPPANLPLTRYDGNLVLANAGAGVSVPFQFRALSEAVGDLNVSVTDEYTYYVADAPKVTNATVRVRDVISGNVVAQGKTGGTGEILLTNISEGNYSLEVTADKHTSFRGPVTIVPGTTNLAEAFISRQTVTYQWTVVPIEIQDTYKIQLESVFEAEVPLPNVIVETPRIMPLVIAGKETHFEIKLRNEGLIAAQGVRLNVPSNTRFVVTPLVEDIGTIPAKGSLTIPVAIRLRSTPPTFGPLAKQRAKSMPKAGDSCEIDSPIPCLPSIPVSVGYYYVCGPNNVLQVRPIDLTALCGPPKLDECLDSILDAAESNLTKGNLLGAPCDILAAVLQCMENDLTECETAVLLGACQTVVGGAAGAVDGFGGVVDACVCDFLAHLLDWLDLDLPDVHLRGSRYGTGNWTANYSPVFNTFGGSSASSCGSSFAPAPKGKSLWPPRPKSLWKSTAPGAVCAKVRIRLEQEAVMTRTAFLGTLEIDNDGGDSITGLQVTLDVRDSANNSVNERFGFRPPQLTGLSDVSGGGVIAAGGSASAQYTFIPTRDAAPTAPATYHVGGTLRYIEGGQEVVVPLLSSTITVMPDARLELKYFQQRDVYSEDPFTVETEPAEPFALGLLVKNNGAGAAKNFRITSAQPKIVENGKGLLVDFQIIGTQVGTQALAPTLTANLGTIPAGGSQVAQWLFTSSLQGKFTEYTASFQHVDSLGIANLSLIDRVEIHELIHSVRAARPGDDNVPDFLVNDDPDPASFPDRLYLSDGTVAVVNPALNAMVDGLASFNDLEVQLTAAMTTGWNYFRMPNPGPNFQLRRVVRSDGRELLVGDNVWTTDRSFPSAQSGVLREHLLHLLDFDGTGSYTLYFRFEDSIAPAVLDVVDVFPNPQTNAVAFVDVIFSEQIDVRTFNYQDMTFTLDGGSNLMNNAVSVALVSNRTYRIDGLAGLTATDGNYELRVLAGGILDFGGNAVTNTVSQSWAKGAVAPVIISLESVSPDPRNTPVSTLDVVFSQPIDPATFDAADLTLTRDGGANLSGTLAVAALSGTTFRISGLAAATFSAGAYVLTVQGVGLLSVGGSPGAGARTEEWLMDASGPTVVAVEQLANTTRSTVVPSLDVTFSEAIDPATIDYHDLALTRNGGANLITAAVQVTPVGPATYRISNFNSLVGIEGAYALTVNADAVSDLAGNVGTGSRSETWIMDVTAPVRPLNLAIIPDRGISATDGRSNTNTPTLTGSLSESNLTVRIFDVTRGTDFGEATVTGMTFSRALDLTGPGTHRLRAYAVDAAANVSLDTFFDVFVDLQSPVITMAPVLPTPRTNAVTAINVISSEALNTNTFTYADVRLTRDDGTNNLITNTVTISLLASNQYRINGLAALTEAPGDYFLTIDTTSIEDLAGNGGVSIISNVWQRLGTNTAPQLAAVGGQSIEERNLLSFAVEVTDADVPKNVLTFSLEPGSPSGASIGRTNGVFTWTPTEQQGPGFAFITVRVTDNGVPGLSSTRTFPVTVHEVNEPPALAAIANQAAYVGTPLNVASFATDPDFPANQLTFALGAGAPFGARIHPASGTFTWSPPPAAAGTTNQITVIVTDNGNPPFSEARPFTVIVGDFLDLSLGRAIVQAGQTGGVPVRIAGNVSPTNVTFALEISAGRLTNLSLQNLGPQTGTLSLEPVGGDSYLLRISALPGQVLSQAQPVAHLEFTAVANQTTAFVPLRLSGLSAVQANGELVPKTLAHDGRVVVVGAAPIIEAMISTNEQRSIVLYGTPGKSYVVECTTNLVNPVWTLFGQGALTNQSQRFQSVPTNQTQFYRAREE